MDMIRNYLAMGGYASFIWPAFGVSALVLLVLALGSIKTLKDSERALDAADSAKDAGEDKQK